MLTPEQRQTLRQDILARLQQLQQLGAQREQASATVELDQTRTGRLSRMDALQAQAMARATAQRSEQEARRLQATLQRLEQDDYGECDECGEPIAFARLRVDPATVLCIDCASRAEQN